MATTELSLDDYRGWLHKGLGRAVLEECADACNEVRKLAGAPELQHSPGYFR